MDEQSEFTVAASLLDGSLILSIMRKGEANRAVDIRLDGQDLDDLVFAPQRFNDRVLAPALRALTSE